MIGLSVQKQHANDRYPLILLCKSCLGLDKVVVELFRELIEASLEEGNNCGIDLINVADDLTGHYPLISFLSTRKMTLWGANPTMSYKEIFDLLLQAGKFCYS